MESVFLTVVIVALVELVKAVKASNWETVAIIACSALIGGLVGYFHVDGLTVVLGIQAGLAASGTYTVAQKVGGN